MSPCPSLFPVPEGEEVVHGVAPQDVPHEVVMEEGLTVPLPGDAVLLVYHHMEGVPVVLHPAGVALVYHHVGEDPHTVLPVGALRVEGEHHIVLLPLAVLHVGEDLLAVLLPGALQEEAQDMEEEEAGEVLEVGEDLVRIVPEHSIVVDLDSGASDSALVMGCGGLDSFPGSPSFSLTIRGFPGPTGSPII